MEALVADIKPYKTKKGTPKIEDDKVYEFELCTRYESSRPVDKKSGAPLGMGYPPVFSFPNRGIAWNEKAKKFENWRFIQGQPSIFISEQTELAEYEKREIDEMLAQEENTIDFLDGKLLINTAGGRLKLEALFAQDYFEGNEKKRKNPPAVWMFRMNNPDLVIEQMNNNDDLQYEAMKQAREKTDVTGMLAASFLLGINIDDRTPAGLARIKNAFLNKAKFDPKNPKGLETFLEILDNPATKMKFMFSQAFATGLISKDQQPGKLTWQKLNTEITDLKGGRDVVEELTNRAVEKEPVIVELLAQIESQINKK